MIELRINDVLRNSFSFLFEESRTIIRLTWAPVVLLLFLELLIYSLPSEQIDSLDVSALFSLQVAFAVISMFPYAIIAVALHCLILFDDRKIGRGFVVQFGRLEWLFVVIGILVYFAYILGMFFFESVVPWLIGRQSNLVSLLPMLLIAVLALRFVTIYPDTVARNRIDLKGIIDITRGNSYKIIAIMVIGLIISYIAAILLGSIVAFFGVIILSVPISAIFSAILLLIGFVVAVFFGLVCSALMVALACYSYKMLIGLGAHEYLRQRS